MRCSEYTSKLNLGGIFMFARVIINVILFIISILLTLSALKSKDGKYIALGIFLFCYSAYSILSSILKKKQ